MTRDMATGLRPFYQLLEPEIPASLIRPLSHLQILPELQQVHRVVAARRRARRTLMNIFFVPIKRAKKASKSQNHLEGSIAQAVELVKEVVAKDP